MKEQPKENGWAYFAAFAILAFVVLLWWRDSGRRVSYVTVSEARLKDNVEQVKLLFDYTKFHITVYATLATLLVSASASPLVRRWRLASRFLRAAVVAVLGAGVAAGIVAASLPAMTPIVNFWVMRTGPYGSKILTIRSWTYVEHSSFWLAVLFVILAFAKSTPSAPEPTLTITVKSSE